MKRKDIMDNCPDEFSDDLKELLDDIEGEVVKIRDLMDIKSISDIGKIDEAHDMIIQLAEDLY